MNNLEKIREELLNFHSKVLVGVHLGTSASIIAKIVPYWESIFSLVEEALRTSEGKVK